MLMILAVPLMGSDCAVAVRSGGPVPPPNNNNPPPPSGGGGGVIIVTSGDSSVPASVATVEAVRIERALVTSALQASVWTPPDFEPVSTTPKILDPRSVMTAEAGFVFPVEMVGLTPSVPVPEPTGVVLFASGLGVAASMQRPRGARGKFERGDGTDGIASDPL
jgi:hypothetical protein